MADLLPSANEIVFSCSPPLEASEINLIEGSVAEVVTTPDIKIGKLEKTKSLTESAGLVEENNLSQLDTLLESNQVPNVEPENTKELDQECQPDANVHVAKQPKLQLEDNSTTAEPSSKEDSTTVAAAQVDPSCEIPDIVLEVATAFNGEQ